MSADFRQMQVHGFGVDLGQDQTDADTAGRTDRAKNVGPIVALIARRARPTAPLGPNVSQAALLADAGFVLPP